VEIVRNVLAAVEADNRQAALKLMDPDVVIDATRNVFNPGTYVGIEGLDRWRADTEEVWEVMQLKPIEFFDAGDRVVVISQLVGKGKGSGVEVDRRSAQVATIRRGRIVRWEIGYTNVAEALEAAGLRD